MIDFYLMRRKEDMNHFIAVAVVTLARVVPRLHVDWVDLLQMVP
jgi:hypothetical protein